MRKTAKLALLAGVLSIGIPAVSEAQTRGLPNMPEATRTVPDTVKPTGLRSKILTSAGNDIGAFSQRIAKIHVSPTDTIKLNPDYFVSDKPISYNVTDARTSARDWADYVDCCYFTPTTREWRADFQKFARTLPASHKQSTDILNGAVKDGMVTPDEIFFNGKPRIKEGVYWLSARSGDDAMRGPVYFDLPDTDSKLSATSQYSDSVLKARQDSAIKAVSDSAYKITRDNLAKTKVQAPAPSTTGRARTRTEQKTDTALRRKQAVPVDTMVYSKDSVEQARKRFVSDTSYQAADTTKLRVSRDSATKAVYDSVYKATLDSIANADKSNIRKTQTLPAVPARYNAKDAVRFSADYIFPVNDDMKLSGGQIGVRYRGVGLEFNYTTVPDSVRKDITVALGSGRTGTGKEVAGNYKSIGAALELHPWHFILGGGANTGIYDIMANEKILSAQGNVLRDVSNSKGESEVSYRYYGGLEFNIGSMGLRAFYGHDTKRGDFAGAGLSRQLNYRKQDRK